jgi:phage tail tape-measure protein
MKTVLSMLIALGTPMASEASAQAPASVVQSGRAVHPPSEAGKASRAARAPTQTPQKRSAVIAGFFARRSNRSSIFGSWLSMESGSSPSLSRSAMRANRCRR